MNESNITKVITFNPLGKYDSVRPTVTPFKATYEEMTEMRDQGKLIPGQYYRITDYVTTVNGATITNARSAGHPFDILVRADSANTLNEQAWAVLHDGDTYFQDARLEAWQLKYRLDNVQWSKQDGRGTITWMKDEHGNECPYDFKNVQFKRYKTTDSVSGREGLGGKYMVANPSNCPRGLSVVDAEDFIWAYTFSSDNSGGEQTDYSLTAEHQVHDNVMKPNGSELNNITFFGNSNYNLSFGSYNNGMSFGSYNNGMSFGNQNDSLSFGNGNGSMSFGNGNGGLSFGNGNRGLSFGNQNNSLSFGSYNNGMSFGNQNNSLSFGNSNYNLSFGNLNNTLSFGNQNNSLSFGNSNGNMSFGNQNNSLSFGNHNDSLSFGNQNNSLSFGNGNGSMSFGSYNNGMSFGSYNNGMSFGDSCKNGTITEGVKYVDIPANTWNFQLLNGLAGTSSSHLAPSFATLKAYTQVACMNSSGQLKIYVPGDLV